MDPWSFDEVVNRLSTLNSLDQIKEYCGSDPEIDRICRDRDFWNTRAQEQLGLPLFYNKDLPVIDFRTMQFDYQRYPNRLIVPVIKAGLFELVPNFILRGYLSELESNKHNVIAAALPSMPAPIFKSMLDAYREKSLYFGVQGTVGTMSAVLHNAFYDAIQMGRPDIAELISPPKFARFNAFYDAVRTGQIDPGKNIIDSFIRQDALIWSRDPPLVGYLNS